MKRYSSQIKVLSMVFIAVAITSCADHRKGIPPHGEIGVAVAPQSISGNSVNKAGITLPVSGGPMQLGVVIPTTTAVASRIQNGLQGMVSPMAGNFQRALNQTRTNLPKVADVNKAAGFDQVQLLAYAACSDLTTGATPLMRTRYNVNPATSVVANQAALVAAGLSILDAHLAGLASQGSAATQVNTVLNNLITAQAAVGTNTTTMVFMSVCIAASTAASTMLGI